MRRIRKGMMENKSWIIGLVALIILVGAGIWGFSQMDRSGSINVNSQIAGEAIVENYFDENATVMYFYSDNCSWCKKQKEVLSQLGTEGYRVKPMNVGQDQSLWEKYQVSGTPTFIAANGDRLPGYQTYDQLKPWLDSHK